MHGPASTRENAIGPAEKRRAFALGGGLFRREIDQRNVLLRSAACAVLARAWRKITVGRLVAELRHEFVAAAFGDQARNVGAGIAEVAEMAGVRRTRRDAGGHAVGLRQVV